MHEIQQLIETILSPSEAPDLPAPPLTPDGQQALAMRQQAMLALIHHPETRLRQEAAELLSESRHDGARQALLELSRDTAAEVRQQALLGLSGFADPETTQSLLQALNDSDYIVRATAAELLGERGGEVVIEPLMNSLKDSEYMVRATAAEALGRLEAFLAAPALQDLLLDSDQWVRYSAAESLAQIEADEPIWALLMDANSADPEVRRTALGQLAERGDRRAIPVLVRMLKEEQEDNELENAILKTLESFHDPLVIPALVELALFTEQAHLREQALLQAQVLHLPATLEALASWLAPEQPQYAQRAIEALHQLPTQDTTPVFVYALQHPDRWVRTVAMLTLEQRQEPVATESLQALLRESAPDLAGAALRHLVKQPILQSDQELDSYVQAEATWKRQAVAENLERLSPQQQLRYAKLLMADTESEVREAALRSLSKSTLPERLNWLLAGTQDDDSWVRQAAVEGLGIAPNAEATARLLEILSQENDFLVRAAAAEALGNAQGAEVVNALVSALDDPKPSVRLQTVHSLFSQHEGPETETLRHMLQDPDKSVLLTVLQYLRQAPRPQLLADLAALLQVEDIQVRSAAQEAHAAIS
ncbi:MAG: HEAT repeat domain-containing protein [Candidatus Sericytochromatia bacterium]